MKASRHESSRRTGEATMNEQMIEAVARAICDNMTLSEDMWGQFFGAAQAAIAAAEPLIRAQVIQEIREAVDCAYMGWSLGRMKHENPPIELIRDALAALEKQP
jgi:hypothetical protein